MSDMCPHCNGAGNIVTFKRGYEWWKCGVCGGSGVMVQYGPPTIHIHNWHNRFAKQKKAKA